jgi:serine/threonine protein kinase
MAVKGRIRIADFGMSQKVHHDRTTATATVNYVAHEFVREGVKVTRRCDVFRPGMVLHKVLAGKPVFDFKGNQRVPYSGDWGIMISRLSVPGGAN